MNRINADTGRRLLGDVDTNDLHVLSLIADGSKPDYEMVLRHCMHEATQEGAAKAVVATVMHRPALACTMPDLMKDHVLSADDANGTCAGWLGMILGLFQAANALDAESPVDVAFQERLPVLIKHLVTSQKSLVRRLNAHLVEDKSFAGTAAPVIKRYAVCADVSDDWPSRAGTRKGQMRNLLQSLEEPFSVAKVTHGKLAVLDEVLLEPITFALTASLSTMGRMIGLKAVFDSIT